MFRIILAYLVVIMNRIIEFIFWFCGPIPGLNKLSKLICVAITSKTSDTLDRLNAKTTKEIAAHVKAVYKLKKKAEDEGDLCKVAQFSVEQDKIRKVLSYYNITNVSMTGKVTTRR